MQAATNIKAGQILDGKYRVERILGMGGMGIVAAARHIELGIDVAVKLLLPGALGSDEAVSRFAREARSASRLRSEHVARVYDVGKLVDGTPYMVMEYLVGRDLDQVLVEAGPLDVPTAATYLLQVCEAMAEAHANGIVHRDLKPKNLFLTTKVDGSPLVKVLDFGIAKRVDPASAGLTGSIAVVGSPAYMSPEQMRASRDVDARTDLWSLGVSLYELTTGVLPFDGASELEVCAAVMKDEPRRPDGVRRGMPAAFADLVMHCLRKPVAHRLVDVARLAERLEPFAHESARGAAARVRQVLGVAPSSQPASEPAPRASSIATAVAPLPGSRDTRTQLNTRGAGKDRARGIRAGAVVALLLTGVGLAVGLTLRNRKEPPQATAPIAAVAASTTTVTDVVASVPATVEAPPVFVVESFASVAAPVDGKSAGRVARSRRGTRSEAAPSARPPPAIVAAESPPAPTPVAVSQPVPPPAGRPAPPAPPPYLIDSARVQVGAPTSVIGTTATNIAHALAGLGPHLTSCYRAALPSMAGNLDGSAVLHLGTDEEGVIVDARVAGGPSAGCAPCIAAAVRGRQVANVDTGRVRAEVPLQFFAR